MAAYRRPRPQPPAAVRHLLPGGSDYRRAVRRSASIDERFPPAAWLGALAILGLLRRDAYLSKREGMVTTSRVERLGSFTIIRVPRQAGMLILFAVLVWILKLGARELELQ